MLGCAGALEVHFGRVRRVQRRHAIETPLGVAPGARADDLAGCCAADGVKIPPVRVMHGQGLETVRGDDMVRQEGIFARVARPGARGQADQPDEKPGHCGERGGWGPDD